MFKMLKHTATLLVVLILASMCVFADDKKGENQGAEVVLFENGTDSGAESAPGNIQIRQNGSFFGEDDLKRCKEVIGFVLSDKKDQPVLKEFSDLDMISIEDSITEYRKDDFIYIVADPSPGMNQLYAYELISQDGGDSWILNQFHRNEELGDMYILDKNIVYVDGIGMELIAEPVISADLGKTYKGLDVPAITKIMSLPAMEGCFCHAKVKIIDVDKKTITFDWFMNSADNAESVSCFYRTKVSYPSFKCVEEEDLSGLAQEAAKYCKTGYLLEKSNSEKLNRQTVSTRFLKEFRLAGAEKTVREIRLAINEIYARKGHDFADEQIREYFAGKKWYKPVSGKKVKDSDLTDIEDYNIAILLNLEKEYKSAIVK